MGEDAFATAFQHGRDLQPDDHLRDLPSSATADLSTRATH